MTESDTDDLKTQWEKHYGERERIWSGRVNARLVEFAADLRPGDALDLGCGEGGDAMWLAEHGWRVRAVDVSDTALQRAATDAQARGVAARITFAQHDLSQTFPEGTFDLVSAQFFHSMVDFDRPRVLRQAAAAIRPGGTLLIVDHGAAPPWGKKMAHDHVFPSAEQVASGLELDEADWARIRVGQVFREAVGPDGETASIPDNVIMVRRR